MNERDVNGDGSVDEERLRRLRLSEFLRDLVRQEGRMEAAALLGVNYKTLVRAEESGEITGRVGDALERYLSAGDDPEVARLRKHMVAMDERMEGLEGGMEELRKELRASLSRIRASSAGRAIGRVVNRDEEGVVEDGGEAQAQDGEHAEEAGWSETEAAPPVAGLRSSRRARLRRVDPEIVTVEPAEDDVEVYAAERQLTLELAMLEEHGLTLPPETQPLRGFGRKGQTSWRWTALYDTRRASARRRLWRWVRRVCTLGLWWK